MRAHAKQSSTLAGVASSDSKLIPNKINMFFSIAILFIRFIFEAGTDNKYVLEIPWTNGGFGGTISNIGNPIYNPHARARLELASMVCHRCGHGVLDLGRGAAGNRVWRWVWNAHDSVWELCEFHAECWVRRKRRAEELGGA